MNESLNTICEPNQLVNGQSFYSVNVNLICNLTVEPNQLAGVLVIEIYESGAQMY